MKGNRSFQETIARIRQKLRSSRKLCIGILLILLGIVLGIVVKYSPKAKEMAARIEDVANQMEQEGFELVSCSITPSSKGILVFRQIKAPQPTEVCEHEKG